MATPLARRLARRLRALSPAALRRLDVAFLPDFFVDHFVHLEAWPRTRGRLARLDAQGGGNWVGVRQRLWHGGNAANAALALARLGVRAHLIAETDAVGLAVLGPFARSAGLDIARVRVGPRASVTTALELGGRSNLMLSQSGPVADFGPAKLGRADWELVESCDTVAVVNWAQNLAGGTELARDVFRRVRRGGGSTFFDTGDPSWRRGDLPGLRRDVLTSGLVDVWGLNENELRQFVLAVDGNDAPRDPAAALRRIPLAPRPRMDLHTRRFAATLRQDGSLVRVPAVPIDRRRRSTGAGDAWNAGNILGDLLGLGDPERLLLAHAVAGSYVSAPEPTHPSLAQVAGLLERQA